MKMQNVKRQMPVQQAAQWSEGTTAADMADFLQRQGIDAAVTDDILWVDTHIRGQVELKPGLWVVTDPHGLLVCDDTYFQRMFENA